MVDDTTRGGGGQCKASLSVWRRQQQRRVGSAAAQGGDANEHALLEEESSSSKEEFVWPARAMATSGICKAISVFRQCFEANGAKAGASNFGKWTNEKAVWWGPITYPTGQPFSFRKLVETGTSIRRNQKAC